MLRKQLSQKFLKICLQFTYAICVQLLKWCNSDENAIDISPLQWHQINKFMCIYKLWSNFCLILNNLYPLMERPAVKSLISLVHHEASSRLQAKVSSNPRQSWLCSVSHVATTCFDSQYRPVLFKVNDTLEITRRL